MDQNEVNEVKSLLKEIIGMTCTIGYDGGYPLVEEKARKALIMIEQIENRERIRGNLEAR